MTDVTLIIPARFGSTRLRGKPLARLHGRPLIEWTWQAALNIPCVTRRIVATDDARIAACVRSFGGEAIMTSPDCRNGTERCAEAAQRLDLRSDIIVNLQGDAPLTPSLAVVGLIACLRADPNLQVATPRVRCAPAMAERLMEADRRGIASATTVVTDGRDDALYFSKRALPFGGAEMSLHLGVYAYRAEALQAYAASEPSALELSEGLEQLRFLHHGVPIRTVETSMPPSGIWEVNRAEDIPLVEAGLAG